MLPNILPTSLHNIAKLSCSCEVMYWQSRAKSNDVSVSLFSPSQSESLLMKCASYLRLAQASRKLMQTEREDRRIWLVNANLSSGGNLFVISNTRIASS